MSTQTNLIDVKQISEDSMTNTLEDLKTKMNQILTQTPTVTHDSAAAQIRIKLDGKNYALWNR
ncbi:conserved hypothetical protein [Ricinus communis]|uniref:Retrotransposon Copia-like N-terminal domain-containing protein n=1 Tax=Ricinus communis TaxID=3988 RepID=B9SBN4_RICCO|nr:conserved hypothetical protein [Ricinus communis]